MVKRHQKGADGVYHIKGQKFSVLVGTRAMVFHGTAYKTAGGLKKCDLIQNNKTGRIVSKLKSIDAKKTKRLEKAGYKPTKGKFVLMRKGMGTKRTRNSKKKTRSK
jgi:hypothetical protein